MSVEQELAIHGIVVMPLEGVHQLDDRAREAGAFAYMIRDANRSKREEVRAEKDDD
jgi:hypothetical protein